MRNKLIFDSPGLQSIKFKYASTAITLIFWVVWFYLWIPLVTFAGWWFQIDTIQHQMITLEGFHAFLDELPFFLLVTACIVGTLSIWAFYNFMRFKGVDRRKPLAPVKQSDILDTFSISETDLELALSSKVSVILIDDDDKITVSSSNI